MTRRHFKSIASAEVGVLGWLVDWILGEFVATEGQKNGGKYQVQGVFELVDFFPPCGNFAVSLLRERIVGIQPSFLEVAKLAAKTLGV